ncbi:DNA polymerase I [Aerococcaceae bacterium INB8]|uniref:DNA polymerase I n=1 Tax=Ruoffia halotolerans TaxID=2748684 RepID=A0A839A387_9LACT|nr:DNA polymerase I [Ruoffia halotolerans]MBA5728467.1 DNA polymerase I [Ruoffia halotolerans]
MSQRKIMLIDGSSLAFRAFYSILDLDRFKNKSGLHTNALYSFHRMLDSVMEKFQPTHILVAFDKSEVTFRTDMFKEYKGGRQKTPSEFKEQMPYLKVLLDAYGMKHYDILHYEADDVIGTLAHQADSDDEVIVISGDKDLIQLATDNVTVYITRKGVSQLEAYTPETVMETYGVTPKQFIELKGLMGDPSDNYPGVTRIGEKTAIKLIKEYHSVEELYERLDELKPSKMKENLTNEKEEAFMSRELAEILLDAPIEIEIDDITYEGKNMEELVEFYRQMEFNSFLNELQATSDIVITAIESDEPQLEYDVKFVGEITESILPKQTALYLETVGDNYHFDDVLYVSWYDQVENTVYVAEASVALNDTNFKAWLEDESVDKILFDSKRDEVLTSHYDIQLKGIIFDTLIAAYLVEANHMDEIANVVRALEVPVNVELDEIIYGKGAKRKLAEDTEVTVNHVASKAMALDALVEPLRTRLVDLEMDDLYEDIEVPVARVLARMEIAGIKVDGATLEEKNEELIERLKQMEARIHEYAGEEFNVNSPKQLGEILFDKMGLPVIKKTKTGYSTAANVLEKLLDKHPIIQEILDYRSISKLQGTYLAGLPGYIKEDGKIHTKFVQTLTQTGRLSSADPNLQNIPVRLEEGRKIRQAFVPSEEGWQLFGADYSQIELRVLAHISQEEHMTNDFIAGEDIHSATARRVFNLESTSDVDSNLRRQAKAVNFGIVYGISDYGLSQNLNIPRPEAKEFIERYFEMYPGVQKFMDDIVEKAREDGYVSTLFHRRRYLPDIKASNFNIRSFAERTAMNSPIQGTAADILKIAMIRLQKAIDDEGLQARILLQVHDELILEAPAEEMERLSELVPEIMEHAANLDVPLEVDYNQGINWYEL